MLQTRLFHAWTAIRFETTRPANAAVHAPVAATNH